MATEQAVYCFRRGRKETGPGILIIESKWELIINKSNKEKTTFWYRCKYRKTKGIMCDAKATVVRVDCDNGEPRYVLSDFTDNHNHQGCKAQAIAEEMKLSM